MQLEKVQYTAKAKGPGNFGLLSRFFVVLFAATMTLAPSAALLAQQPAHTAGQNQGESAVTKVRTDTAVTQPGTVRSTAADAIRSLDNITLYWLTNTGVAASRLYWEYKGGFFNAKGVKIPVAVTVFPGEQYEAPRSWTERAYPNLIYYNRVDKGGHFAALEQPMIFAAELRAAFKSIRFEKETER